MTRRLVIGNRLGDFGMWQSVPGKNVMSPDLGDDDFLIRADSQNLALLLNGTVHLTPSASHSVLFPGNIGEAPVIAHSLSVNGVTTAPAYINYDTKKLLGDPAHYNSSIFSSNIQRPFGLYSITSQADRFTARSKFAPSTNVEIDVRYLVFMMPLQ